MMFKKKPNIPSRPSPPSAEQITEDVKNAPNDDVVFVLANNYNAKEIRSRKASSEIGSHISPIRGGGDSSNPDIVYEKVKKFIEVNANLSESLNKLQDQNDLLLASDAELRQMADEIRRQAKNALQ